LSAPHDHTPTPRHERIGSKYEIVRILDHGPGTVLYEARNVRTNRPVQVEVLEVDPAEDEENRRRFLREAKLAAHLDHGNIVSVYDMGETRSGSLYIVQELLEDELLSTHLRRVGPLSLTEAADIVLPLMDALEAIHAIGIVHGSVTPQQVRLVELNPLRSVPKLVDLGLAWQLDRSGITRLTVGGRVDGGPPLVAPELLMRDRVTDPRVDVWGICAVLFRCLTGRRPFEATNPSTLIRQLLRDPPPRASSMRSGIHPRVDEFLMNGLAREPDDRFPTIRDAKIELTALVDEVGDELLVSDEVATEVFSSASGSEQMPSAGPRASEALRFGMLVPGLTRDTQLAQRVVGDVIGRPCAIEEFSNYASLVDAICEGEVDLAWLPPVAFVRSQHAGGAQLLLTVERSGRVGYSSALLGRRGEVDRIDQIHGKRAAWVDKWAAAGYLVPRAMLRDHGIDPDRDLSSQGFVGSYDAVLEALTNGTAQIGGAYCAVGSNGGLIRSAWSSDHPVTVLSIRGPIPGETICCRPDLDVRVAMRIIRACTDAERSGPIRALFGASRFAIADPKAYEALGKAF